MAVQLKPEPGTETTNYTPAELPIAEAFVHDRARIQALLPEGVTFDRLLSDVFFASRKVPQILQCTPASVVQAAAAIQQWGLVIGQTAYLVPFGRDCTPVADYKGLVELVIGSGVARVIEAHAVYENEPFNIRYGTDPQINHAPLWKGGAKGALLGAYAYAKLGFHNVVICYMRVDEIEAIRSKSRQWGPDKVKVLPEWYAVKTAVRRLCKTLPKNPKLARVMAVINAESTLYGDEDLEQVEQGDFTILTEAGQLESSPPRGVTADGEDTRAEPAPALEEALRYLVPGGPDSWGKKGGQPLGEQSNKMLDRIADWAAKQAEKPDGYARAAELLRMARTIIAARQADEGEAQPPLDLVDAMRADLQRANEPKAEKGKPRPVSMGGEGIIPE